LAARSCTVALVALALALTSGGCAGGRYKESRQAARAAVLAGSSFSDPTTVDNPWLPLRPGTSFIYVGTARDEAGRAVEHRVVFYVTDKTKVIDGLATRVLWDRDFYAGVLKEDELTFWAQDDVGTVWNFGEYPEEVSHGRVTGAPDTWIAGIRGARAGISMPAHPQIGTPAYPQGFAPAIEFADEARAEKKGVRDCVPAGCFENMLVNEEWAPAERGSHQLKYYAPQVGLVRVGYKGRVTDAERLVLVRVVRLGPRARAAIAAQVLRADRRAQRVSPAVYGRTEPAR
jgi:hypothetical protein